MHIFFCPCGVMEAHPTSNRGVAGSSPVMDFFVSTYQASNTFTF
jgi:hypothetical protein